MALAANDLFEGFGNVLVFGVFGAAFVFLNLYVVGKLILRRPAKPDQGDKGVTYECAEPSMGDAWIRFDIRFYTLSLIFLIFDIEVALLFPWAVAYGSFVEAGAGAHALFAMVIFLVILAIGLAYDWIRRDLEWTSTKPGRALSEEALVGGVFVPRVHSDAAADAPPAKEESAA